ncbi:hypothetical protein BT93_L2927 [Corymbia citriodora subsp. variegata]|uniref:TIR domain-containing protein n=1 Tax=Corymbia citriodora subsp. variegata TaxID=360336 RepID=A0A8T0D026_CORYI|nr:hypothetical protein BT93_L2927 [Corymbia citriodora subsp. variegata]
MEVTSVSDSSSSLAVNNGGLAAVTETTSMSSGYDYDVFLSFRGPDTRFGITDSLRRHLIEAGIHTFIDSEDLRVGEKFGPKLLEAIRHSKIAIPIFSKDYALSKWCLNELVEMMECRKTRRQMVMPIFHHVTPSEVRYQTGSYGKAFLSHEEKFDGNDISKWKAALKDVTSLMGWVNRGDGLLVRTVVRKVIDELKTAYLLVTNCLVGVESHVKKINTRMFCDPEDVRILGIHGMGGVGKTTLAKVIYNRFSYRFENCCFLSNVRETSQKKGIEYLQNQLLSDILKINLPNVINVDDGIKTIKERLCGKKVLVLLDDVNEKSHLDELMGSPVCFGLGSRIIITSRNKDVFNVPEACCPYELTGMDFRQSLQLFCKHAFGRDHPLDEHANFSNEVVKITGGLPLALKVIGSLLSHKSKDHWGDIMKKFEKVPREEVKRVLKISYDALDEWQKQIFLDMACLFIGFDKRVVFHIWNDSNLFPGEGLQALQQMSLIKIGKDNRLWMHNQLRDFGRDIVHQECDMQLERQTILWNPKEASKVVIGKKGTKYTKALCLEFDHHLQQSFTNEELGRLSNLRYLEMRPVLDNWPTSGFPTNSFSTNSPILSELRWLSWHNFPPVLTLTTFSMMNMVILDLSWSKFSESWDGWSHIKMARKLKVLNLTGCAQMHKTPDLSSNINLEQLILESCGSLTQIDKSIGQLTQLVLLNLKFCRKLCKLPEEMANLESLEELLIDCTSIREVPGLLVNNCSSIGNLTSLSRLPLENVAVSQPPLEIRVLIKLEQLSLSGCKLLKKIPDSICNLESLVMLNLSHTHIVELPKSLGNLKNLKILRMRGSSIRSIPSAIGMLEKLKEIDAEFCQRLEGTIPEDIGRLSSLEILNFSNTRICNIPKLPESLLSLHIGTDSMKTLPDLSNLINLTELNLEISQVPNFCLAEEDSTFVDTTELEWDPSPRWIGNLCNLESLKLSCDTITVLHGDIGLLSELKRLELLCFNLQILPSLPSSLLCLLIKSSRSLETSIDLSNFEELSELRIYSSAITDVHGLEGLKNLQILDLRALNTHERLLNLSNLKKLNELQLGHCLNLIDLQSIQSLGNLRILKLIGILQLDKLPNLSNLKKLTELHLLQCHSLTEIQSFEGLEKLIVLKLGELPLLERLPDLSNLKKLTKLDLQQCHNLVKIQGRLDSLEDLCIYGCNSLVDLPDPSSFKNLKSLQLHDCEMLAMDQAFFLAISSILKMEE